MRDALPVELIPTANLRPYPNNPRTHSKAQLKQIAASIERFGFVNPVLISDDHEIVAGHGRVEAAKRLGMTTVPSLKLSHLNEAERRAYVLADNRLAELAGWDRELLAIELQGLIDLDFEIEITGFETAQVDLILDEANERQGQPPGPEDQIDDTMSSGPAVSRLGDVWRLGDHRLVCGNALEAAAFDTLMAGDFADLVFTDPPYNVAIAGHVSGLGRVKHGEFAMASGEMTGSEFTRFLQTVLGHLAHVSRDGSIHFVCMDWRHVAELHAAGMAVYDELKNVCVWVKDNGGMGTFYRSRHELVFAFKKGTAAHVNTFELGQHGRYRTNVWEYAGVNTLRAGRLDELAMHPTVKPVAMVADAIKDCSRRKAIVLDPFCGSGTILIAAEKTGRRARAMELEPAYVDAAIRRWQAFTSRAAVHAATGLTFEETQERQMASAATAWAEPGPAAAPTDHAAGARCDTVLPAPGA